MASDVTWLGTSRSPVIVTVTNRPDLGEFTDSTPCWSPQPWNTVLADAQLRVPTRDLLERFDRSFEARKSSSNRVEPSGQQRPTAGGNLWPYAIEHRGASGALSPRHWGRLAVVALDSESEMTPRTPATYLVARAFRAALMDAFSKRDTNDDAPSVLHGHGEVPHLAIVPLPFAGHRHADGTIRGLALIFPHPDRLPDVAREAQAIEAALEAFFPGAKDRRQINVPGAGSLLIRPLPPSGVRPWALSPARYLGPSQTWTSVTPVVHSRWQKGNGAAALAAQVAADCAHVGLPEPTHVELLRASAVSGGANRLVPRVGKLRDEWRTSLQGPQSHLKVEFGKQVEGPVLLGRARHFGVGLLIPAADE
jgi:CRISPR-associated protein Csb2